MPRLLINVAWKIEGPFLTAGTGMRRGLDSSFHRAAGITLSVAKTHVKGKMREAAEFVAEIYGLPTNGIEWWFGQRSLDEPKG